MHLPIQQANIKISQYEKKSKISSHENFTLCFNQSFNEYSSISWRGVIFRQMPPYWLPMVSLSLRLIFNKYIYKGRAFGYCITEYNI